MAHINFSENKILKVTPGKMTRYVNDDWEDHSGRHKSFASISSNVSGSIVPARMKLHINQLKLSKNCLKYVRTHFKGEVFIKLLWSFFDYSETVVSPEKLEHNKAKFDYTTKFDFEVGKDFLEKLMENALTFDVFALYEGQEVFLSQQQHYVENIMEAINTRKDLRIMFTSEVIDSSSEHIGFLDIWYKISCKQKSFRTLFAQEIVSWKKFKSVAKLSDFLDKNMLHQVESLGAVHVTDSEMEHFSDGLLLVLNRNKVLKTSQTDISTELEERVKWLRFEANWKQTLQENAILHGKDPKEVAWRQWRDEDTANVRLRTYHNCTPKEFPPHVHITVVKLIFFEGTPPLRNSTISKIYVEYEFLNCKGPDMETPFSLPKPEANHPIFFDFKKTFDIDIQENFDTCQLLANLIRDDEKIQFMVIGEPGDNPDMPIQTCQDIGYAELMLNELIQLEENVDEFEYEILDVKNPVAVVGYLTVKVEGILAMRKMALRMMAPKGYDLFM